MSRIPSLGGFAPSFAGPLGQGAEAARVFGQALTATDPAQRNAYLASGYAGQHAASTAGNQYINDTYQQRSGGIQNYLQQSGDQLYQGYGDRAAGIRSGVAGISGGYGGATGTLQSGNKGIAYDYGQLLDRTIGLIGGIGKTAARDINDRYAQDAAKAQQRAISAGLGASSLPFAVNRGLQSDRERAQGDLTERIAGLQASNMSELGRAGLGFRERGLNNEDAARARQLGFDERGMGYTADALRDQLYFGNQSAQQVTQQANRGLDFFGQTQFQYPDVAAYYQIARDQGAGAQGQADRNLVNNLGQGMQRQADQAGRGTTTAASPTFGGGFARGVGGLEAPLGNYGATASFTPLQGTLPGLPAQTPGRLPPQGPQGSTFFADNFGGQGGTGSSFFADNYGGMGGYGQGGDEYGGFGIDAGGGGFFSGGEYDDLSWATEGGYY